METNIFCQRNVFRRKPHAVVKTPSWSLKQLGGKKCSFLSQVINSWKKKVTNIAFPEMPGCIYAKCFQIVKRNLIYKEYIYLKKPYLQKYDLKDCNKLWVKFLKQYQAMYKVHNLHLSLQNEPVHL